MNRANTPRFRLSLYKVGISIALGSAALFLMPTGLSILNSAPLESASSQETVPPPSPSAQQRQELPAQEPLAPAQTTYESIFQNPIPTDQLAFLGPFAGTPSNGLIRDKEFRKLLTRSVIPNCMFHYGHDMALAEAMDAVIKGSPQPVKIRDGRYVMLSGAKGPYLGGRGFIWIDLQEGIALGGFYFHPTNGEPTPAVNIFSRQVLEKTLALGQLPPEFYQDLLQWSVDSHVPPVTPRYFITGSNKKILLEHDEDFCASMGGIAVALPPGCEQMNADAADTDLNAAYYVEQTHHATNATAWMITDTDMAGWLQLRENTCKAGPNPLQCRIRMTRERIHVVITPRPAQPPPHR